MPPNRFESEVESFLEGSHGDRTHIKRADHPRLHHYAGRYSAAQSVCPGAELPPPTGTAAIPAGAVAEPTKLLWRSSHRLRWGFCSIRSWLAACRRRVVALMTPFPPFGDGSARPPPFAPAAPGVRARSASLARPRPCVLRPERIGLISRNLVLHSRVASAKIVVSTPTWRVIRPPVR